LNRINLRGVKYSGARFQSEKPRRKSRRGGFCYRSVTLQDRVAAHFSEVAIVLKLVLRAVPTEFTAVMIAIAIPAAIRPYSIAVAPD
jgi:hypothetical protein